MPNAPVPQNGSGATAPILGIVGAATSWIPYVACLGGIACVLAIVFGVTVLSKANGGKAATGSRQLRDRVSQSRRRWSGAVLIAALRGALAPTSPTESAVVAATETGSDAQGGAVDDPDDSEEEAPEEAESPIGIGDGLWEVGWIEAGLRLDAGVTDPDTP